MGFVALKPLLSVLPSTLPEGPVPALTDEATKCGRTMGALIITGTGWSLDVRETQDGLMWEHLVLRVSASIEARDIERLNRVLKGTGFPKVETDWRTKKPALLVPGRRVGLPVRASGTLTGEGTLRPSTLDVAPIIVGGPTAVVPPPPPSLVVTYTPKVPVSSVPATPTPVVTAPWERPAPTFVSVSEEETALRAPVSPTRPVPAPEPLPVPSPLKAERLAPVDDPTGVFTWPTEGSGIVVSPGTMEDLDKVWRMHVSGTRQVVALIGPAGTGKTSLAYDLAAKHKVPVAKVDAAGAVTFADWVGFQSATERNGATVTEWSPSGFIQAVRADGPMAGKPRIVIIDEVNRAESSGALNALLPVCDHTGSLYIADALRSVPIDQSVLIVFTANIGGAYTGTVSMDAALEDRVTHWVEMLFPSEQVEVDLVVERTGIDALSARRLVKAAAQVRAIADRGEVGKGIGPRKVLQAAQKVAAGFTLIAAARSTWVLSYSGEGGTSSERSVVRSAVEAALA